MEQAVWVDVSGQKKPAVQVISTVDRAGQNEPKPQAIFVEVSGQCEPPGQSMSVVEPAEQCDPAEQAA
jgi:hypothetical protein